MSKKRISEDLIKELNQKGFIVATSLYELVPFYEAEEYHQDYYERHKKVPYCHSYRKIF
jgi:peptide-methionine (S)-S-oxide reductase/peptide methionine sulfoxide reductase msrA/msrB